MEKKLDSKALKKEEISFSDIEKAQELLKEVSKNKLNKISQRISEILEEEGAYLYVDNELKDNKITSFIRVGLK